MLPPNGIFQSADHQNAAVVQVTPLATPGWMRYYSSGIRAEPRPTTHECNCACQCPRLNKFGVLSKMKTLTISLFPIGQGLAVLLSAIPALANSREVGVTSTCVAHQKSAVEELLECKFPTLGADQTLEIQYVSMTCIAPINFQIYYFEVMTTPPNSNSEVSYQIPITSALTNGDFYGPNNGNFNFRASVSTPIKVYEKAGTQPGALIDITFSFNVSKTYCTVSLSGEYKE